MNKVQIAENFFLYEFECKDGSHLVQVDENLIRKLQALRFIVKKPIQVCSGYRTPEYNSKIGGAKNSQHMHGKAADIKIKGYTPQQVADLAEEVGFKGLGVYQTFTHVDVRPTLTKWKG